MRLLVQQTCDVSPLMLACALLPPCPTPPITTCLCSCSRASTLSAGCWVGLAAARWPASTASQRRHRRRAPPTL